MVDEGYSSLIDSLKCYTVELYFVLLTSLKRSPSVLESTGILVFSSCNLKDSLLDHLCTLHSVSNAIVTQVCKVGFQDL